MIIGTCRNGMKCICDLPEQVESVEEFESLIYGYNKNPASREELQGQSKLLSLNGPMFKKYKTLSSGEKVAVIRYEKPSKY